MPYPYWKGEVMRSSGPDPVTGPGDADRDKKGLRVADRGSLAPSTKSGRTGEGGLFEADEGLLSELPSRMYSVAPSV